MQWGILGTGNIAQKFADQLKTSDTCRLVATASRRIETAREFADHFGGRALQGYEALLAERDVEAVYISLPNSMHHQWSIACLRSGKHVLCEKPIASNARQAEEMFRVAQSEGRVLLEAFMYRHHPAIRQVIELVQQGGLGALKFIRTQFTFNRPPDPNDIRYQPDLAGGALMDVGCYCVNFSRVLVGRPPSGVHVVVCRHPTGVDEYAAGTLDFDGRPLCTFTCGMTVDMDRTTFIAGSQAAIEVPDPWFSQGSYVLIRDGQRTTHQCPAPRGTYALEAEHLAAVAGGGAEPLVTPQESIENMHVLDRLRELVK